ncbi:MAG: NAD-dependent protein deacylase [Bacteroidales bacterium]|nr:NAD-dependent protein deacylase [Candidatus Liminaster caballi]
MKRIVFLTGAGMSAESGISTFRDSDGLWEQYSVEEICTHEAWLAHPAKLLDFYNMLRRKYMNCKPNEGHRLIGSLEDMFDVYVITQNLDNLHEQGGSKKVLHLHGEMMKSRADGEDNGIHYPLDPANPDIKIGDCNAQGVQLRPHIVFFGEAVPNLEKAAEIVSTADIVVIIGTSLNVYPAASLITYAPGSASIFVIDPKPIRSPYREFTQIQKGASEGMRELIDHFL